MTLNTFVSRQVIQQLLVLGIAARLTRLARADWGKAVAHAGLGITIFAICALVAWQKEDIRVAYPGEPFTVGRYDMILHDVTQERGPNYFATVGEVHVFVRGKELTRLYPEKRNYPVARMPTMTRRPNSLRLKWDGQIKLYSMYQSLHSDS